MKKLSREININGRLIAEDSPPYVIAEISANHNGNFETAIEIIKSAKRCGADAVKIQTYTADTITLNADSEDFQIKGGLWDGRTLYDLYDEAHMPWEWHKPLFDFSRNWKLRSLVRRLIIRLSTCSKTSTLLRTK